MPNTIMPFDRFDNARARGWYERWRERIHAWLERNADSDWADILLSLPDLFMFAVGVMSDRRIPYRLRLALFSAVVYVLSPFDLIPEAAIGVAGLVDDAGVLILILDLLFSEQSLEPDVLEEILRDHWHGEDLVSTIRRLLARLREIAGNLFERILSLVKRWWPMRRGNESETHLAE